MAQITQVEELIGREATIVDTVPASIFAGVERFYARNGYVLQSFLLVERDTYEATFVAAGK